MISDSFPYLSPRMLLALLYPSLVNGNASTDFLTLGPSNSLR